MSGYVKVPHTELTAEAESQQNSGENQSGTNKHGYARNVVDGDTVSYWHTNYNNNDTTGNPKPTVTSGRLTAGNKMTITLANPETVAGVTWLPRQDQPGNGILQEFTLEVQQDGSDTWMPVTYTGGVWVHGTDFDRNNWLQEGMTTNAEKEFLFDRPVSSVKKVRFTVTKTDGWDTYPETDGRTNPHISAAEIGVLKVAEIPAPEIIVQPPVSGGAVSDVVCEADGVLASYDKTENPAGVSGDFQISSDEEEDEIFTGRVVIEDAEKLNISSATGMAITFRYKCDTVSNSQKIFRKAKKLGSNGEQSQYGLEINSDGLAVWGCNPSGGWPQLSMSTPSDFAGRWHTIRVAFTSDKYILFVDDVKASTHREAAETMDLNKRGPLILNHTSGAGQHYADFKIYSGFTATDNSVETTKNFDDALQGKTPVFELGRCEEASYDAVTTWKNGDDQAVTTFDAEAETYTVTTELTAKNAGIFTEQNKPSSIILEIPNEQGTERAEAPVAEEDVQITERGKKMTVSYTFAPIDLETGVTTGCENKGSASVDHAKVYYNDSVEFTADPEVGYTFEGWYTDKAGTMLYNANANQFHTIMKVRENQTLYAKFEPKVSYSKFKVTVWKKVNENSNGWIEDLHWEGKYNDDREGHVVDLSQVQLPAGREFSHWEEKDKPGVVFSAERDLKFRIPGNLDLIPVFKDETGSSQTGTAWAKVSDTYLIRNEDNLGDNAKVRFVGKLHIPEGWTLNETGLFWTGKDSSMVPTLQVNGDQALPQYVKKIEAPKINVSYQFSATVSGVPVGATVRGVIYAKMTDTNGNTRWYYSEEVPVTHTDIRNPQAAE